MFSSTKLKSKIPRINLKLSQPVLNFTTVFYGIGNQIAALSEAVQPQGHGSNFEWRLIMKTEPQVFDARDDISSHAFFDGRKNGTIVAKLPLVQGQTTPDLRDRAGGTGPIFTAIIRAGNRTKVSGEEGNQ